MPSVIMSIDNSNVLICFLSFQVQTYTSDIQENIQADMQDMLQIYCKYTERITYGKRT